jgi:hypothetical protein
MDGIIKYWKKGFMHNIKLFGIILIIKLSIAQLYAQAVFVGGVYTQNFGTTPIAAWTNNTSILGWYLDSPANYQGAINITAAAPSNNGGQYMYTCSGGSDLKLGTRPSNGSGGGPCANAAASTCGHGVGVRLLNTFGNTIVALMISYDWYQFSLAQNGGVANGMFFSYKTGVTVTSITGGAWTNVAALDFLAPQSSAVVGSAQLNGYPCNQTGSKVACVIVNVPHGEEIMLRWWDPNCSNNDPHLGIDNISITAYADNVCLIPLPVDLTDFSATEKHNDSVNVQWITQSEVNSNYFQLERSFDATHFTPINTIAAKGNSQTKQNYSVDIKDMKEYPETYFRLKIIDQNGNTNQSNIISLNRNSKNTLNGTVRLINDPISNTHQLKFNLKKSENLKLKLVDVFGKNVNEIDQLQLSAGNHTYNLPDGLAPGTYFVIIDGLETLPIQLKLIY